MVNTGFSSYQIDRNLYGRLVVLYVCHLLDIIAILVKTSATGDNTLEMASVDSKIVVMSKLYCDSNNLQYTCTYNHTCISHAECHIHVTHIINVSTRYSNYIRLYLTIIW